MYIMAFYIRISLMKRCCWVIHYFGAQIKSSKNHHLKPWAGPIHVVTLYYFKRWLTYMGVSKNRNTPKWKWMIWAYHYFWKHPYIYIYVCVCVIQSSAILMWPGNHRARFHFSHLARSKATPLLMDDIFYFLCSLISYRSVTIHWLLYL